MRNLNRRRSMALVSAAVLAASGIAASIGAANAAVTGGGGQNAQGTPGFYRDAQGVALQLCTDPGATEAICGAADAGAVDGHFGTYFEAAAAVGRANNPLLDASWVIEAVDDAGPVVFNATRFRLSGLRPNTTYRIRDPWGARSCRTDASGGADCKFETNGAFNTVPNGRITTFLRGVGGNGGAQIANPNLANRVTGSPTGFNKVVLIGPNRSWSTDAFTVVGLKRANTAMSAVNKRSLELGNGRQADVVTRTLKYSSFGTASARPTIRKGGLDPRAFSVQENCAAQAPGTACGITVTFAPRQNDGVKRAFLTIDDNGLAAPRRVSLKGVGLR